MVSLNSKKEEKKYLVQFTIPVKNLFDIHNSLISEDSQEVIIDFINTHLLTLSDIDGEINYV